MTNEQNVAKRRNPLSFRLERRTGLRDPDNRLAWAEGMAAQINRYREYQDIWTVGTVSVARSRNVDDMLANLQFRSEPIPACADGEFRFQVSHGNRPQHDDAILEHLVEAERWLVANRSDAARIVRDTRDMTRELFEEQKGDHAPVTIVAIGCVFAIRTPMRLQVELEVLGHRLAPGVDRICASSLGELRHATRHLLATHARRYRLRTALHRQGVGGRIGMGVVALLEHAGMDLAFVLRHLERRGELPFTFGKGHRLKARLFWNEGSLECSFRQPDLGLEFDGHALTIQGRSLPETVMAALPGNRLEALVLHPYLPSDAVITSVRAHERGRRIVVGLEPGRTPAAIEMDTLHGPMA